MIILIKNKGKKFLAFEINKLYISFVDIAVSYKDARKTFESKNQFSGFLTERLIIL